MDDYRLDEDYRNDLSFLFCCHIAEGRPAWLELVPTRIVHTWQVLKLIARVLALCLLRCCCMAAVHPAVASCGRLPAPAGAGSRLHNLLKHDHAVPFARSTPARGRPTSLKCTWPREGMRHGCTPGSASCVRRLAQTYRMQVAGGCASRCRAAALKPLLGLLLAAVQRKLAACCPSCWACCSCRTVSCVYAASLGLPLPLDSG